MALAVALFPAAAMAGTDVDTSIPGFEPHTAVVNPQNPAQVAVGQGCTVVISNDFGLTFPVTRNTTAGCNGDIAMAYDSQGRLFLTHLDRQGGDNELTVLVAQITDTTTPGAGTYTPVVVSNNDGNDDDKPWLVADATPSSPYRDNLYLVWTRFTGAGNAAGGPTAIAFNRSQNQGGTWSGQTILSAAGEGFVWPSHAAVAGNGDVYVAYHTQTCGAANTGTVELLRDGFGGANFAGGSVPQKTQPFTAGQATITCNRQDDPGDPTVGDQIPAADFWLQGSMQPWILPDPVRAENVYVVANDDPNDTYANGDDADVLIARSADFGVTFSVNRVDHGPGQAFAVMPTAHIDQDGTIGVHWYDNRRLLLNTGANSNGGASNFLLDLYGTASRDGGQTFTNDFRINDGPFDPDAGNPNCRFGAFATNDCTVRIGEYNGVWSVDGIGYGAWTGNTTPPVAPFPSDGVGGQTTMFDVFSMLGAYRDRFEPNESRDFAVVAGLGSDQTYNQARLSLHSEEDVDVFEVTALDTGWLRAEIAYNGVVSGLQARAFDVFGNVLATSVNSGLAPGSTLGIFAIPVARNDTYFVEVRDPNAPNTLAPQSSYDLTITTNAAPVPYAIDLVPGSDSGASDSDDLTNMSTPTVRLRVDDGAMLTDGIFFSPTNDGVLSDDAPGYKVRIFRDGNQAGFASQVAAQPGVYEFTFSSALTDGVRSITGRVLMVDPTDSPAPGTDHAVGSGGESQHLAVRIDTVAPIAPSVPDLLASSDTGGVNVDDVTTLVHPTLKGTVEANTLVRLLANGDPVGSAAAGTDASDGTPDDMGAWQVESEALADDVYSMQATSEDLAGNVSALSGGRPVIVANEVLNLSGAYAATGDVTVDLGAETATPFPVPGGVVGVRGIPTVNLDASGNDLTTLGTSEDDGIEFTPTGADSGRLTRNGSSQLIRFSGIAGILSVDPIAGVDAVTVNGTADPDTITSTVDTVNSIQVAGLKTLTAPAASTERMGIDAGLGVDVIDIGVLDTVSEHLIVKGGEPLPNKPNGDEMNITAASPRPKMQNMNGPGADGSAFVGYPRTTGVETRVDYVDVERVRMLR